MFGDGRRCPFAQPHYGRGELLRERSSGVVDPGVDSVLRASVLPPVHRCRIATLDAVPDDASDADETGPRRVHADAPGHPSAVKRR